MRLGGSRGRDRGSGPPPLKNHNTIKFPSNIGPDPLKNHKVTKPASNVGLSMVRHGGSMLAHLWWYLDRLSPHQLRKNVVKVEPPLAKLSGSVQDAQTLLSLHCEQIYDVRTLSIL